MDHELLRLIAITDDLHDGVPGLVGRAIEAVRGGATMVQLRLKHAEPRLLVEVGRALVAEVPAPIIVNDRPDIALAVAAAGVHLGPDDLPVHAVRPIVPPDFIIGATIHDDAGLAGATEADYVSIGSVFGTRSKRGAGVPIGLEELARLVRRVELPAVAAGGINAENAASVMDVGVVGVAALSALLAAEHPDRAARAIRSAIGR